MSLEFQNISHAYDSNSVLSDVSFVAGSGQVTCLLGPSGCGKTTLLRIAAGLIPVQTGAVLLNGETLATPTVDPPPEARPIGLVFQEGALFPHLTVRENVEFGIGGLADPRARALTLLNQVGLEGFEDRFPHTLSGGQQQRVALARALAPSPKVLLLDEPFANIDSQLRRTLRQDTRQMLMETDAVAVLVTHDPEEALEMADHLVVLKEGRLIQQGTPDDVFDSPVASEIARLFGNGQPLTAHVSPGGIQTPFGLWPLSCLSAETALSGDIDLVVRPESLTLESVTLQPSDGACRVVDVRRSGAHRNVRVSAPEGQEIICSVPTSTQVKRGDTVLLSPIAGSVFAFPKGR